MVYLYLHNELLEQAADIYENLQYMHENKSDRPLSAWQAKLLLEMLANDEFRTKVMQKHREKFCGG